MIKVMHLDMFYFDYEPIFSEDEKVIFKNGQIMVLFQSLEKALMDSDISNIKIDTLFDQRLVQGWSNDEVVNALKSIDLKDKTERDKYKLCFIKPEDEITVSFDYMVETLSKLNYDSKSFSYIAAGQ